ncbi:MAG: Fpg/Nei family DNA glycosylase [Verrucomicrobia bacterium]|nr:Fpg/Nei family DNA glycosylase [Verrucomicrobiota bacterium]
MPELAEVEYYRRQWDPGLGGRVLGLELSVAKRVFRGMDGTQLEGALKGKRLEQSHSHGKQMLFGFSGGCWLGVHLGMTGSLRCESPAYARCKHDHLMLKQRSRSLVFSDPRCFGRLRFERSSGWPEWWSLLPPAPHSEAFSFQWVCDFLRRRARTPLKSALLDQAGFPGVGNWMADEILWRAGMHPRTQAARLGEKELATLWRQTRSVSLGALKHVAPDFSDPPSSWLFRHRWKQGGCCPRDGKPLQRDVVGGRTTVWCERCQPG